MANGPLTREWLALYRRDFKGRAPVAVAKLEAGRAPAAPPAAPRPAGGAALPATLRHPSLHPSHRNHSPPLRAQAPGADADAAAAASAGRSAPAARARPARSVTARGGLPQPAVPALPGAARPSALGRIREALIDSAATEALSRALGAVRAPETRSGLASGFRYGERRPVYSLPSAADGASARGGAPEAPGAAPPLRSVAGRV